MLDPSGLDALLREQRLSWEAGTPRRVEEHLERYPELRAEPEAVLHLIYNEMLLREQQGQPPTLEEYLQRFPELTEQLRLQFHVHDALPADAFASSSLSKTRVTSPDARTDETFSAQEWGAGYELIREIGRGSMGVVYEARQLALKRRVALKMILAGTHASPEVQGRFRTEAEAVARLQHPNIVQIYEVGEDNGQPYLALELVEGGSLAQKLAGAPQPPLAAATLTATLARAMHYAHSQGVVHRDLKPANILLQKELTAENAKSAEKNTKKSRPLLSSSALSATSAVSQIPKITDFGLAKRLDDASGLTGTNAFLGTPSYMAPEQAAGGAKDIGPAADVYALGAILYEMLTGRPPFRGATVLETVEQVRSQEPVPPTRLQPRVPRDLETICLKCLEKEPARRYGSCQELADDLERFLAHEPIWARPTSLWLRGAKWARRRPAWAALIAVSMLAALILIGSVIGGVIGGLAWHNAALQAKEQKARLRDQDNLRVFFERRDDALFHVIYGSGQEMPANLAAAQAATEIAMGEVFGRDGRPDPSPYWRDEEKAEVFSGAYELLLMLSKAVLRPSLEEPGARRQRAAESLNYLIRAERFGLSSREHFLQRARCLRLLGDEEGAQRADEVARQVPDTGAVDQFLQGDAWYQQHDLVRAHDAFEKVLQQQPDHFWAQYYLMLCHLDQRQYDDALTGLTACLGRRPRFVWTRLLRGYVNSQLHRFDAAEQDFSAASELGLQDDALYALEVHRGTLNLLRARFAEAQSDLQSAAALQPERYEAYLNLALLARQQQHADQALHFFDRALRTSPPAAALADLHAHRADLLLRQQRFAEAVEDCDAALQVVPDRADVLGIRAQALLALKDHKGAVEAFTRYLEVGGRPDRDIYRGRGQAQVQLGNFADALQDYTLGLARGADAELHNHRGWAYFFIDAWKPALADFETAWRIDPNLVDALIGRALCRVMLGTYRAAAADAEEAWRRKPTTPEMMHNLACVFAQAVGRAAGDTAAPGSASLAAHYRLRAMECLQRGLELVPAADRASFWREKMSPDTALDPIRGDDAFKQLAEKAGGTRVPR